MKKHFVKAASLLVSILGVGILMTGCGQKESESITFFNYGANIDSETLQAFEKEYGITVKMDEFDDMEMLRNA